MVKVLQFFLGVLGFLKGYKYLIVVCKKIVIFRIFFVNYCENLL